MVARNEIYRADLGPPAGRRPVCVLTRDAAIGVPSTVTCAPVTRTIRGIESEVEVGPAQSLPGAGAICCFILTVPKARLDAARVGVLGLQERAELDRALRFGLDIVC